VRELDPYGGDIVIEQGERLRTQKRYEEAIAAYRRVIALEPGDADYYYSVGLVLARLSRYAEAVAAYEEAIEIGPAAAH
jgi:tetratricopeptide (TPR) repeat protein